MTEKKTFRQQKLERLTNNCIRELYAEARDKNDNAGDWDLILQETKPSYYGWKIIPIYKYYIPSDRKEFIMNKYRKNIPLKNDLELFERSVEDVCPTTIIALRWSDEDE